MSGAEVDGRARPRFMGAGTVAATIVPVILGVLTAAMEASGPVLAALAVLAAIYAGLATVGMAWAERRDDARATALLLALQVPLVAAVVALGEGRSFLVAMPLVSMFVLYLGLRSGIAVTVGVVALIAAVLGRNYGTTLALQGSVGVASAAGFVVAFSYLVRREQIARHEVERLHRDLRTAHDRLAESVAQIEELATTKERNRIAREVHDGLGHTLTVASMQLEAARTELGEAPVTERIERVQQILRDGLGELRRSVSMLRAGPSSPQAFARAIAELVEDCNASSLRASLETTGTPRPLPGEVGFALYRAAQEALTNVRRHARASAAIVRVAYRDDRVALSISDDGVGAAEVTIGNGLAGLRERVEGIGGSVAIESDPGRGLTVRVEVPA